MSISELRPAATRCPHCDAPVVNMRTRGHDDPVMFDAAPVIAGPWVPDETGRTMTRKGAGPHRGYVLHARTCPVWAE